MSVRANTIAALTMVIKMKAKGHGPNLVARELALELGGSPYQPAVATHTPGAANVTADLLSRLHAPGGAQSIPRLLVHSRRVTPPARGATYYLSRAAPDSAVLWPEHRFQLAPAAAQ